MGLKKKPTVLGIEWTDEVIHQLQAQADLMAGHVTQLGQELKQVGKKKGNGYEISISAPFYWKFFNYGVTGSGDPAPSEFYGTKVFDSLLDYNWCFTFYISIVDRHCW